MLKVQNSRLYLYHGENSMCDYLWKSKFDSSEQLNGTFFYCRTLNKFRFAMNEPANRQ